MSIHRDITHCGHRRRPDGKRESIWIGACHCGWEGEPQGGETLYAADKAKGDYREHVEQALGAEAYYDCAVRCKNCGSEHRQGVLVGTHVTSEVCAYCGTRMLMPDNEAWHESTERARRTF